MPRITCPYCKVQYGHEWWCWFKKLMYRKPKNKWQKMSKTWDHINSDNHTLEEMKKISLFAKSYGGSYVPRIGCHICGKFVEMKHPQQKPSHTMFCWWKKLQMKFRGE